MDPQNLGSSGRKPTGAQLPLSRQVPPHRWRASHSSTINHSRTPFDLGWFLASVEPPWVTVWAVGEEFTVASKERQEVHDKLHRGGMGQGATDPGDGERVGPGQRAQARGHREGGGRGGRV